MSYSNRIALLLVGTLLAASACGGNGTVPSGPAGVGAGPSQVSGPGASVTSPADDTSILKKLTKDVIIGSTVDPTNGDMGGHALSVVKKSNGLTKGQLLVHPKFGKGVVLGVEGQRIEVLFEDGPKKLGHA